MQVLVSVFCVRCEKRFTRVAQYALFAATTVLHDLTDMYYHISLLPFSRGNMWWYFRSQQAYNYTNMSKNAGEISENGTDEHNGARKPSKTQQDKSLRYPLCINLRHRYI